MVENKKTKRQKDIKSKLLAAIAMLLVSSIMMVSTTYAWFTLSTAPEVTGITTAVGSNGNLEMALLPSADASGAFYENAEDAMDAITSGAGDSMAVQETVKANVTWGNLVDLSDESYGMSEIVLYPSALNIEENATSLTPGALLSIPSYGADGRVTTLANSAGMTGIYDSENFYEGGWGVRAVGTSSDMSARELAYRGALATANSAANNASTKASSSLSTGGTAMASLAMKRKLNDTTNSGQIYTATEVKALLDVYTALKNGALADIETAMRNYLAASYLATTEDEAYADVAATITNPATELSALATYLPSGVDNTLLTKLADMKSDVETNIAGLTTLLDGADYTEGSETTYTWSQFSSYLDELGDTTNMEMNGESLGHWTEKDESGNFKNIDALISAATSAEGLTLEVYSGIYHEIAQYSGNITAKIRMENITYAGITTSINATMKNYASEAGAPYLNTVKGVVPNFTGSDADGESPISDFYGYIIDMAFRTNAADSYLKLQTNGIDRIYSDNTANDATMGGGSTMTFSTKGLTGYNQTNLVGLMECIRVVFFNPDTMEILGYARLDSENVSSKDVTETTDAGDVTYTTYTMSLYMYDEATDTWATSDKIVDLTQNTAEAVSVLVYLDGTTITNADVSTANITGSMNLQFSSSATLTPMNYTDLRNGTGTTTETTTEANGG